MRLSAEFAAAQAAQPLIVNVPEDAPDEKAGVEIQPHMPTIEVAAIAAATATTGATGAPTFDEEGPVWPTEASAAISAEVAERGETLNSKTARELAEAAAEAAAEKKNLPSLGELVDRIPSDVRDTVEDLFRVKWTQVVRVPRKTFKE